MEAPLAVFTKRPWEQFKQLTIQDNSVSSTDLVDIAHYRLEERKTAGGGTDPIEILNAYAQDRKIYDNNNILRDATESEYAAADINDKANKFKQAYKSGSPILLHKNLADVVVDAAIDLYNNQQLKLRVYDGLRTVDAGYLMYHNATPSMLGYDDKGQKTLPALLAEPGTSAHNRALAVDTSLVDTQGREIERFDNLDMESNNRNYQGDKVTLEQRNLRILKEQAFQRAAIKNGIALAPLQSEFWDDRMPGADADLWRVIDSLARCTGQNAPEAKATDYATFCAHWQALNAEGKLVEMFGQKAATPPPYEHIIFHEKLNPIYDRDLPEHMKQAAMDPVLMQEYPAHGRDRFLRRDARENPAPPETAGFR